MPDNNLPRRPVRVSLENISSVIQAAQGAEREQAHLETMLRQHQAGTRHKVHVVCRRVQGAEHIADVMGRHERVLVAKQVAGTVLSTGGAEVHPQMIALRAQLEKGGGMLKDRRMGYDEAMFRSRLTDANRWMVLQAGEPTGEVDQEGEPVLQAPIADIQVQIPTDDEVASLVAFVPQETDTERIYPAERERVLAMIAQVRKNPALLACIEDITVDPDWQNKGVGRALIGDTLRRLRLLHRQNAIAHLVASMFVIRKVRDDHAREVSLKYPIYNKVSMVMHATTPGGYMGWSDPESEIQVALDGSGETEPSQATIVTGWQTAVIDV